MLLALATPKLCDRFSLARASPLPLWRKAGLLWGLRGGHLYTTHLDTPRSAHSRETVGQRAAQAPQHGPMYHSLL